MKVLKKSALSLAVAGVVYGTALTPVYAADVEVNTADKGKVVGVADSGSVKAKDSNLTVANGDTLVVKTAITPGDDEVAEAGLIIDTNANDTTNDVLELNVTVDAAINASAEDMDTNSGLLIKTYVSGATDSLKGNIVVNADITSAQTTASTAVVSEVAIEGDFTVNAEKTISGTAKGVDLQKALTGNFVNNGSITVTGDTANDAAVTLTGVSGTVTNTGTVNSNVATNKTDTAFKLNGDVTGGFNNSGTITGSNAIDLTTAHTVAVTNSGTITGDIIATHADSALTITNSKTITGDVGTGAGAVNLTNTSAGTVTGSLATGAGNVTVTNAGTLNVGGDTGSSTGTVSITNTGIVNIDAAVTAAATASIQNSKTVNVKANASVKSVTNDANGTINLSDGDDSNAATIALTIADDFTNDGIIADTGGTGTPDVTSLILSGKLTNNKTITVDTVSATGAVTNSGTLTAGTLNAAAALTNSGTLTASTLLNLDEDSSNSGKITAATLDVAATKTLTNSGTLIITVATTGLGTVKNTGTVRFNEGVSTGTAAIDTTGGSLGYHLTNTDAGYVGAGTVTIGAGEATVGSSSKIVVSASDAALNAPRTAGATANDVAIVTTGGNLKYKVGSEAAVLYDADNAAHTLSVSSNSVLLKVSDVKFTDATITADLEVMSAKDVVKGYGLSASAQEIADKFHADHSSSASGFKQTIQETYGSLASNSASESSLKSYVDNVRPDDTNSAAMAGANVAHSVMSNIGNRASAVRTGANYGDMQVSGGFWIQGLYGKSDQKAREGALAYKGDLRGMTFGIDREMGDNTAGIAFSYGKSDVDFARDQKDEVKSYVASVYNIWEKGNLYVDSSISLGTSKHESKRFTGAAAATAKYGSMQMGGQATVGYNINIDGVMLEPKAAARLTMVNVDANRYYRDSDNADVQSSGAVSYHQMELGFGADLSKAFEVGSGTLTPRLGAMYYHDFVGDQLDTQVNFADDNYAIKGASAIKNSWELNLGVSYAMGENLDLSAGYTRVMKNDFSSDNVNAKLKYMF